MFTPFFVNVNHWKKHKEGKRKEAEIVEIIYLMDPLEGLNFITDNSIGFAYESQRRGHKNFFVSADDLYMSNEEVYVQACEFVLNYSGSFEKKQLFTRLLKTFDVVLLRKDPPIDNRYLTLTYMLERVHPQTLVVNDPTSVRNYPEKLSLYQFPGLFPPSLITRDRGLLQEFYRAHQEIILKPLYGNGGKDIFYLAHGDPNWDVILDVFLNRSVDPIIAQKFLPEIKRGDKRILLLDGKPIGILNRIPVSGSVRSNLILGGTSEIVSLSKRDEEICEMIGPFLKEKGFLFTGIDVIGHYLTEINVTSPTGMPRYRTLGGNDGMVQYWDLVEEKRSLLRKK